MLACKGKKKELSARKVREETLPTCEALRHVRITVQ